MRGFIIRILDDRFDHCHSGLKRAKDMTSPERRSRVREERNIGGSM